MLASCLLPVPGCTKFAPESAQDQIERGIRIGVIFYDGNQGPEHCMLLGSASIRQERALLCPFTLIVEFTSTQLAGGSLISPTISLPEQGYSSSVRIRKSPIATKFALRWLCRSDCDKKKLGVISLKSSYWSGFGLGEHEFIESARLRGMKRELLPNMIYLCQNRLRFPFHHHFQSVPLLLEKYPFSRPAHCGIKDLGGMMRQKCA